MAFIRDWATSEVTVNRSHVTASMPTHVTNDLLLWILSKDDSVGPYVAISSGSGWAVLNRQVANAAVGSAIMWKFASSSNEAAPIASSSDADAHHTVMLSIGDAHPTLPFNVTASTSNAPQSQFTSSAVTTTTNDCLMIWAVSSDGAVTSALPNPGVHHLMSQDSATVSTAVAWGFQRNSGSTPRITWTQSLSEDTNRMTLAIANATNGRIPAYIDRSINPATVITPLHHFSTLNGIIFPGTLAGISTIGSKSTFFRAAVATADFGINPYSSAITLSPTLTPVTSSSGFRLGFTTPRTYSSGTIACSFGCATPRNALTNLAKTSQTGTIVTLVDGTSASLSYHIAAADSNPDSVSRSVFAINPRQRTTTITGSATFNSAVVTGVLFTTSTPKGAASFYFSEMVHIDKLVVAGGDTNYPVDVDGLYSIGNSYRLPVIQQTGASSLLSYTPIQIGGGDQVNFALLNSTLQFPRIYDASKRQLSYHASPYDIGISYYGNPLDVISHKDSIISSPSPYYWDIHVSASSSASYDFSGLTIVGAGVTLRNVTTFTSMNFIGASYISASSCALNECIISTVPSGGASFVVNSSSSIQNCTINVSTLNAGEGWCYTTTPNIFANNSFVSTGTAGHALVLLQTGTYSFTGNTFTGFGLSGSVNAALFNNSSGSITLNIVDGDVPTYRDGINALTVINNAKTLTLTNIVEDSEIRVFRSSDNVELASTESSTTTFEYQYNYVNDIDVDIVVLHISYEYLRLSSITLGSEGVSIPVQQRLDRVYSNS